MSKRSTSKRAGLSFVVPIWSLLFLCLIILLSFFFLTGGDPKCANTISCITDLSGAYDAQAVSGEYLGRQVTVPHSAESIGSYPVLGDSDSRGKRIEIDLETQRLYAFEYDRLVYEFPVSTGKWGRTPTGTFSIWIKLRYTRMTGGNQALGTYYNLPNVPYTMFFYNKEIPKARGYGIHGAYWHNNFGYPMSHGCINMREEDVAKIYNWAGPETEANTTYASEENPGTKVIIYGTAPQ